jgi:hypothetical protein
VNELQSGGAITAHPPEAEQTLLHFEEVPAYAPLLAREGAPQASAHDGSAEEEHDQGELGPTAPLASPGPDGDGT